MKFIKGETGYSIGVEISEWSSGETHNFEIDYKPNGEIFLYSKNPELSRPQERNLLSSGKIPKVTSVEYLFNIVCRAYRDYFLVSPGTTFKFTVDDDDVSTLVEFIHPAEVYEDIGVATEENQSHSAAESLPMQALKDREVYINESKFLLLPTPISFMCISQNDYIEAEQNELCFIQWGNEWKVSYGQMRNQRLLGRLIWGKNELFFDYSGSQGWMLAKSLKEELPAEFLYFVNANFNEFDFSNVMSDLFLRIDLRADKQILHSSEVTFILSLPERELVNLVKRLKISSEGLLDFQKNFKVGQIIDASSKSLLVEFSEQTTSEGKHWRFESVDPDILAVLEYAGTSLLDSVVSIVLESELTINIPTHPEKSAFVRENELQKLDFRDSFSIQSPTRNLVEIDFQFWI